MNEESLEQLQIEEQVIKDTAEWWHKEITAKTDKFEAMLSNPDSDYDELEELRQQILVLQKKGSREQELLKQHEKRKKDFLFKYMVSGCMNLNLDY